MENKCSEGQVKTKTIGFLLLEAGKLKPSDADAILKTQKDFGCKFGDAAIKLGLVSQEDILQVLSYQFDYDTLPLESDSVDPSIITAFNINGSMVDELKGLRSQLSLRWFAENKFLAVTATSNHSGTSYISANLAVMFSQLGQKTLLIDANMQNPSQNNNFKTNSKLGFSDVLANRISVEDAVNRVSGLQNLSVLNSGTLPPNPLELIGHGRFLKLKNKLDKIYDVVIVDTPAMLDYYDAQSLISVIKGALLVVRKNETKVADVEEVKQNIATINSEIVGVVLNEFK